LQERGSKEEARSKHKECFTLAEKWPRGSAMLRQCFGRVRRGIEESKKRDRRQFLYYFRVSLLSFDRKILSLHQNYASRVAKCPPTGLSIIVGIGGKKMRVRLFTH